mmetsp:Transcript_26923/g.63906  ORF Transcript_26923/g.63906 Transcript_26923/m.63906 type:complete len:98 (+) Transcript_26923:691-984(+)
MKLPCARVKFLVPYSSACTQVQQFSTLQLLYFTALSTMSKFPGNDIYKDLRVSMLMQPEQTDEWVSAGEYARWYSRAIFCFQGGKGFLSFRDFFCQE